MLFPASSRKILCSTVLVLGTLSVLPGCKHAYRGNGSDSTIHSRFAPQPVEADYDGEVESHSAPQFESLPDLSPVPPLPGAGHSLPGDDVLPPSPSPDSVSPTSLQLDSKPHAVPSPASEPNLSPVAESTPRWKQMLKVPSFPKRAVAQPLPPLKPGRYSSTIASRPSTGSTVGQSVGARPQSALMHSAQFSLRQSSFPFKSGESEGGGFPSFDSGSVPMSDSKNGSLSASTQPTNEDATIPVIAPIRTRTGVVEHWPHQAQKRTLPSAPLNSGESNSADSLDPAQAELTELLPLPVAAQTSNEDGSPSLLPPGP